MEGCLDQPLCRARAAAAEWGSEPLRRLPISQLDAKIAMGFCVIPRMRPYRFEVCTSMAVQLGKTS